MDAPLQLHIGGTTPSPDWRIVNIQPGPDVDYVADCTDLAEIADGTASRVYASHILEHLDYKAELPSALAELHRVLAAGGELMLSVPDMEMLCRIFVDPNADLQLRVDVMRILFGGQEDRYDFHKAGLFWEFLGAMLLQAGFTDVTRVGDFGLFEDSSSIRIGGVPISLNVRARKPA